MKNRIARSTREEPRSRVLEYGLIAVLIGIGIVAAATALGGAVDGGLTAGLAAVAGG